MIFPPTTHFTADSLLEAPTPIIVDEITCVVESGMPILDAISIMVAADVSAANPLIGLRLDKTHTEGLYDFPASCCGAECHSGCTK